MIFTVIAYSHTIRTTQIIEYGWNIFQIEYYVLNDNKIIYESRKSQNIIAECKKFSYRSTTSYFSKFCCL